MSALLVREQHWQYPTFNPKEGVCLLRVWHTETDDIIAMVTELPDNPSASITNSIERIRAKLVEQYGEPLYLFEHYPHDRSWRDFAETLDYVVVNENGAPGWVPVRLYRDNDFMPYRGGWGVPIEELPDVIRDFIHRDGEAGDRDALARARMERES